MADLVKLGSEFSMYKIMAALSVFVRQFCLSNPFEALGEGLQVNVCGSPMLLHPEILNWIASFFLPGLTYSVVGIYYQEKSSPIVGSFLYLTFYIIHNLLLELMCGFGFTKLSICIIVGLYILCHIVVNRIRERFS